MECDRALEWMMRALDGELDPAGRTRLEEHLAGCVDCRAEWDRLQALERVLREAPLVPAPAGFAGRTMARIDRRRQVWRVALGGFVLGLGTLVATVLALGPSVLSAGALIGEFAPLFEAGRLLALRMGETLLSFAGSLWVTAGALIVPLMPLALCGLFLALVANLTWLGLVRRLHSAPMARANA
jgi:anti-sigma factor RsiW